MNPDVYASVTVITYRARLWGGQLKARCTYMHTLTHEPGCICISDRHYLHGKGCGGDRWELDVCIYIYIYIYIYVCVCVCVYIYIAASAP